MACSSLAHGEVSTNPVPGKVVLGKASYDLFANTSYMVISGQGTVVLMDTFMTLPGIRPDLVTVSHFHGDHFDPFLLGFVKCARATARVESFTYKDVRVDGLASTHDPREFDPAWPTNVVYVLTVDGIRIAHLGDFAQTRLTEEQRRQLTGVDVLIAPCTGSLVREETAVQLIREIGPRMVVPTHCTREGMRLLKAMASDVVVREDRLEIDRDGLVPGRTTLVLLERSDGARLFLRFLAMELPTYPITQFVAALLLGLAAVTWMASRAVRRRRLRGRASNAH